MSDDMKYYTIIAGANGVGKTSLYEIIKSYDDLGTRINIDEMVSQNGNWWDALLHVQAGRRAIAMINDCIKKGETFHHETTLPGRTIIKQITRAKQKGFQIRLYFVGVEGIDIAIDRVNKRVEKGGHGVGEKIIRKRFELLPENLLEVIPYCDIVSFYDNTVRFRQIAVLRGNVLIDCDKDLPVWFTDIMKKLE